MKYLITNEKQKHPTFYFYKTTNMLTGQFYYGSGSKEKYLGSGLLLNIDINKFGKEHFKIEKLRFFETREQAFAFEDRFLKLFKITSNENSYNLKDSAMGGSITRGHAVYKDSNGDTFYLECTDKRVLSGEVVSVNLGKFRDKEWNKNISLSLLGTKLSETTKQKISNSLSGRKSPHSKVCIIDGSEFESITKASSALGIPYHTIRKRIKSKEYSGYFMKH